METETNNTKRKRPIKKILLWTVAVFLIIISAVAIFLYYNFNQLLTDALMKSFNSNIMSDVYELKFEKLSVNILDGDVKVYNVEMQPREKPLQNYPYINSEFRLRTKKMSLKNVEISTLIKENLLKLDKIEITEPDVELRLGGTNYIVFPFVDTTNEKKKETKKAIESFFLKEFGLINASVHVTNLAKEREYRISKLNISLEDLMIDQRPGRDLVSNKRVDFSVGEFEGSLENKVLKYVNFKDFKIAIDSFGIQQTVDTAIYRFTDFSTSFNMLDVQTADSTSHLTIDSFNLSYKQQSIKLNNISFKPNISDAAMQKKFTYQYTQFSGTVGTLNLKGVNFDSLIYGGKIFIDSIVLDKISASVFKDQRKPVDKKRFPGYPGQQIKAIPAPLLIKNLQATNVELVNNEQKPDGDYAKANINRATLNAKNITTLPSGERLTVNADAYIENKAHANVTLSFSYDKPAFSITGTVKPFNLPDLNTLLKSYTPAGIEKGIADEITFSGNVYQASASGTMKFLYHDLKIDLAIPEKAKWQSSVLAFAANTYLNASNPPSSNKPPRIVRYYVARDMNKGFINILIKSVVAGLKETMIMSKENTKAYNEAKREARKAKKAEKKAEKKANNKSNN